VRKALTRSQAVARIAEPELEPGHGSPGQDDPLWQTCTALHIIKHAQALMYTYLDYCHQILYKSTVPFSRFSIFTKRFQKVQLPAALYLFVSCMHWPSST